MASELLYLSHCMVLEAPLSARDIAQAVGKPYSTLLREVNPYDTGAKLGVETLLELMRVTRNITPLRYMAQELGCTLIENKPAASSATQHAYPAFNQEITAHLTAHLTDHLTDHPDQ